MNSILVVAAHPDDEVLGCGATMARLAKSARVDILILGEGATSRHASRQDAPQEEIAVLQAAARRAGKILGARSVRTERLPDNRFDEVALLDIVKLVEASVAEHRPDTIFTHHPGDLNVDHRLTFQAVITATRPMKGRPVRRIYSFEIPSSTEWAFGRFRPAFSPQVFLDATSGFSRKLRALACYDTEARRFPHPRSPRALRASAEHWGSVAGLQMAEAFELIRDIG